MRSARSFLVVALIALGFSVLPGGTPTLNLILALLSIAFFAAIALLGVASYGVFWVFQRYRGYD
jgi:hypothetical protein